jgi:CRP-like cAMP-binding protein
MALDDDIRILSAVKLFEGFTQEQLRLLAFGAEATHLQADHKLYREDDEADSAYIVVSGRIVLYREQDGDRIPIGTAGPGTILSELALIADSRRLTSASAETDSEVIRLSRKMFRRILEEYPDVAVVLHRRIFEEFQELVRSIEELAPRFAP